VEVRVRGGRADVSVNDVVRRGDLLISGVIRVGEDGVRYEYAAGQVLAQVMREIDVRVPLVQERKVYTEEELCEKTVIFFGKQVKLFTKSGIVGSSYGKIEGRTYDSSVQTRQWVLPGGISLPVWIRTETFRPYVWETAEQSEEQAYAQALRLYREKMEQLLSEAEILSLETSVEREDGEVRIFSRAVCLSDIARTSEISLTESAAP